MARGANAFSRCGGAVVLAVATSVAVASLEMFVFRRYGGSPVPGPYELDGTVPSGFAGGGSVGWVWLGDSLSAGVGADRAEESLPWQTAAEMAVRVGRDVELICTAVPGAASVDVLTGQVPRAVSVLGEGMTAIVAVGCNDVLRLVRPSAFRVSYAAILRALAATGAGVVAVGVPDLGSMMAVMAQPLRALVGLAGRRLDETVRDIAYQTGAAYVAIDSGLLGRGSGQRQATLSADGWHPNGDGYRIWARLVADHLVELDPPLLA
jgi:lysophospholipase L1-like esterase